MIRVKRVYDPPEDKDGVRILVDRLWPRGVRKGSLRLDCWLKEIAPSDELRRWFRHDPSRWEAFKRRYFQELHRMPERWQPVLEMARKGTVTLLYAAKDRVHNNAVALKEFLTARRETGTGRRFRRRIADRTGRGSDNPQDIRNRIRRRSDV